MNCRIFVNGLCVPSILQVAIAKYLGLNNFGEEYAGRYIRLNICREENEISEGIERIIKFVKTC